MKLVLKLCVVTFSAILLTACGNSTTDAEKNSNEKKQQEQKVEKEKQNKIALLEAEKKQKEKVAKEKQAVLEKETKNVINTIKNAEDNPTWENYNHAKKAIEKMSKKNENFNKKLIAIANTINANEEAAKQKANSSSEAVVSQDPVTEKQPTGETNEQGYSIDETTLTGFLNKYGMTPVAYKIQQGMSEDEALSSTPRDMKMSGEIQNEYMKYGR